MDLAAIKAALAAVPFRLPLVVADGWRGSVSVHDSNGRVATFYGQKAREKAEHFILAVNNLAALVAEVERLQAHYEAAMGNWKAGLDERDALLDRLAQYEPPEGERDETMVCPKCRAESSAVCMAGNCGFWINMIPRWRYDLAERIKRGEK